MYIGLKNIQNLFSDLPNLLTASDGIHCLTGWAKLESAPHPYTNHLLYTCVYSNDLDTHGFAGGTEMHLLCIASPGADLAAAARRFPDTVSLLMLESDRAGLYHSPALFQYAVRRRNVRTDAAGISLL